MVNPYQVLDTKTGDRSLGSSDVLGLLNASTGPVTVQVNPINNGNIAATGNAQGNSTVLGAGYNFLTGATYTLPVNFGGQIDTFNVSGGNVTVFAPVGNGTINGGSANGNISIPTGDPLAFVQRTPGSVYSKPAVAS